MAPVTLPAWAIALVAEHAALQARVAQLEAAEGARAQRQRVCGLRRGDGALLAALLPAIAGKWGSEEFLTRELVEASDVGLRYVLKGLSRKSLGRLLARGAGIPVGSLMLEARGEELRVRRWAVVGVFGVE